jgi:hypothetical protein
VNQIRLLIIFCFTFISACDEQDSVKDLAVVKREVIDMNETAVNRRWFEAKFRTSYDNIKNIDGACVSWGMSGQCRYSFDVIDGVTVKPKDKYETIQCEEINFQIVKEFSNDENLSDAGRLICQKASHEGGESYWISVKLTSKHYVWDIFEN